MSDTATQSPPRRRPRGTGFPVVPLADAVQVIKELGKYGKEHSLDGLATTAGHTTTNSGAFKSKVAGYRDWGLLTGTGNTILITDLAWRLAHPDDAGTERAALREAFFNAEAFTDLYRDVSKGQPLSVENLGNKAVQSYGVAASSKTKFIRSFVDSAITAELATRAEDGGVKFFDAEGSVDEKPVNEGDLNAEKDAPPLGLSDARGNEDTGAQVVLRQAWPTGTGQVLLEIRSRDPLEAGAFALIGELVGKGQELAASLGGDETPDAP